MSRGKGSRGQSSTRGRGTGDPRIDGVIQAMQEIGNVVERQAQERTAAIAQAVEAAAAAAFLKLKTPKFDGKCDPEAAPRWVEELEKAFEVLGYTEAEKVTLAVYQLQDNASDWWKATRGRVFLEGVAQTWAVFSENFYGKFFSESARERKLAEMVEHPEDKARRFRDRLKADIRTQLIPDQVDRAAASGSRFAPVKDNRRFGKKPMAGNRRFVPPVRKNIGKPNYQQNRFGACFKCGSTDHQIIYCPQLGPAGPPMRAQPPRIGNQARNPPPAIQGRPPAQGRVYAMARREAEDMPGVVTGDAC
ncbi:uncharacterized protein LOC130138154 [Syzygium oleosum]|uniref:uncharacterized protein LOC130138154 n=1 Tax=Syzygium oleosum TaxID=219896 RepID=UPI0024B92AD7|nr:uncharacterized protein LOC130138154 [Syzygium oleosum]